jgi:hypothetical protein
VTDKEFNKLQREWYAKLADSGFQDLEQGRDKPLSRRGTPEPDGHADLTPEGKTHWYESRAEQLPAIDSAKWELLHRNRFPNAFHREVWRRHCEGESIKSIKATLRVSARKVLPAYQWCCNQAGIPTAGYRGRVDNWDKPDKRPQRRERPSILVAKCGLKELLTIAANMEGGGDDR